MKRLLFLTSLILLSACATTPDPGFAELKHVNSSVEGLIKALDRVTPGGGIRAKSDNGREVVSRFHPPKGDPYANATNLPVRAYTKIMILGDRRPYDVLLYYIIEERTKEGTYRVTKRDLPRAKKILKDLHEFLTNRPDKDNFIDDFRPF